MTEITGWIFPNTLATTKEKIFWKCWAYLVQIHQNSTPKKKNLLTVYFSSSRINYKYFHNIKFSSSCNKHLPTNKLMLDLLTTVPFTLQTLVSPQLWRIYMILFATALALHEKSWKSQFPFPLWTCYRMVAAHGLPLECWELAPQPLQQEWKPWALPLVQAGTKRGNVTSGPDLRTSLSLARENQHTFENVNTISFTYIRINYFDTSKTLHLTKN